MMSSSATPAATLAQEIDAVRQLLQLLEREQSHLLNADIEELETLVEKKALLVDHMAQLASARHRALSEVGLPPEEASMPQWLARDVNHAAAAQSWNELLSLTVSAKELNRTNGMLIGSHMARNQQTLQVLHGNAPGGSTYGADGRPSLKTSGRNFIAS